MEIGAFELNEPLPKLKKPHALAMLQPWVDVGSVGSLTLSWLEAHFEAKGLARLAKPGDFFDFTRYRPTIYYQEGRRQVNVPNTYVTYGRRKTGNDFLFLHLLEPHSHGEVYVDSVLQLLERFGVKRYCLIGSMYDLVPHTRPLTVTGGGVGKKAQQDIERMGIESSSYQGPTTFTYLIQQGAPDIGIETMSFIVHLPQYTQMEDDYMGVARLMEMLGPLYDVPRDESYIRKAEQQLEQISLALDKNPQLRAIVEELETRYEARANKRQEEETPRLSPEIEKFLSEMERRFREN
ncbi:MAG: PAC2 family protein [Chloroflexi bacterium]|nr:PAC2 family protein [Chloroflexota bacterium]